MILAANFKSNLTRAKTHAYIQTLENFAVSQEIQDELMEKRRALGALLIEEHEAEDPDTFSIYDHIDEIGDLQAELEKEVTRQILMARTVLDSAGQRQFFWMLGRRMGSDFPDMRPPRQDNQNNRPE